MNLKKIMVTSDCSTESTSAFEFAAYQAKVTGAELIVLNIFKLPMVTAAALASLDKFDWLQELEKQAIQNAENKLTELVKEHFPDQPATARVVPSLKPVSLEICDTANRMGVGLIIISSHGHGHMAQRLIGSTAERLMRESTCPVALVPIVEERQVQND